MRIIGKLTLMAATALCVASCAKDTEQLFDGSGVPLQVSAVKSAGTRAGLDDTDFMENDQIGLFLTAGYDAKYRNVKATGKGSGSGTAVTQWTLEQDVLLTKKSATVAAYYPYNGKTTWSYDTELNDFYINVNAADQTDYLRGYAKEVSGINPKADIIFRHAMARLRLKVSYFDEKYHLAEIGLSTVAPGGRIYLISGKVEPLAVPVNVLTIPNADKMPHASEGFYDVLLFPQSATTATLTLTFSDGKAYTATVSLPAMSSGDYNILPITVKESSQPATGSHEYIDLGLSVKWATCNVGATKPEDYGDYFAWGETSPKSGYSWSTYKYCKGSSSTLTKYCYNSSYGYNGFTDSKTVLDPADDAARANWGGSWRMPTYDEFDELRNTSNCTWTWTTLNGVSGYKVVSKKSGYAGNWIFLPAAGYRYDTNLSNVGSYGRYWSSSLDAGHPYGACDLSFNSSGVGWSDFSRDYGRSVRPVFPVPATSLSLDRQSVEIMQGGTETLTANVQLENGVTVNTATWSSSNASVATVDQTGKITAISAGICNITASSGSFTATCSVTVKSSPYKYVDLGLSVKWATCNVGATKPEDYGDYFAWGETSPKSGYSWSTYKYCKGSSSTLTKYCNNSSYGYNGFTDSKTVLDPADDAARANWGGSWRMPTKAEQDELRNTDNCTWTWTTLNGVNGYKVVSKKSGYAGNWIFLPAAGYRYDASLDFVGSVGLYWSSSLSPSNSNYAYYLYFNSSGVDWSSYGRYNGPSVRPVCP